MCGSCHWTSWWTKTQYSLGFLYLPLPPPTDHCDRTHSISIGSYVLQEYRNVKYSWVYDIYIIQVLSTTNCKCIDIFTKTKFMKIQEKSWRKAMKNHKSSHFFTVNKHLQVYQDLRVQCSILSMFLYVCVVCVVCVCVYVCGGVHTQTYYQTK